jgi:hypothetical protein
VIGYVIAEAPATAARLERDVRAYAAAHRLGTVAAVYRDPDTTPGTPRTGFRQCLEALRTGRAHGVIVPHREDIGADPSGRATLLATVHAAGGVVHYIDTPQGAAPCR